MIRILKSRTFLLYTAALSTPLFAWFVLFMLAQNSSNSFDPNPWVQGFVTNPGQLISAAQAAQTAQGETTRWIHIVSERSELMVQHQGKRISLTEFKPGTGSFIFLVEAQGPTLASQLFQYLKDEDLLTRSLVLAVSDGFLKDVRYYHRDLALGAGQAYLVRFRALQTLKLEKFLLINMSGIWLQPEVFKDSTQLLTDTFVGLHVPVFIGPVTRAQIPSLPKNANYLVAD
jgi:hypothetical protein